MSGSLVCGGATIAAMLCVSLSAAAATPMDIQRALVVEANQNAVPVSLALAVAKVESGFQAGALSPKGARGVMQIMPATALGEFGVEADHLWDAGLNVRLGVQYLKRLQVAYGGRWDLALSHYNGGTVKGDSPSSYTRDYVAAVQAWQAHYQQRGCDRLTAKRIITHADSFALCLGSGSPIVNASLTIEAATAEPSPHSRAAAAAEPTPPMAAPQTPVEKSDLAKPAAKGSPANTPTSTASVTPAVEKALTAKALADKLRVEKTPIETAQPAARAAAAAAEPARQPTSAFQPTPEPAPTVAATSPQPWQPPTAQPAAPVVAADIPAYRPAPTPVYAPVYAPVYYGRPRHPRFARGVVQSRGGGGPRRPRWW